MQASVIYSCMAMAFRERMESAAVCVDIRVWRGMGTSVSDSSDDMHVEYYDIICSPITLGF
jgi:hypothetical protein